MIELEYGKQIESFFVEQEPANIEGEGFTPSAHGKEFLLEDIEESPEDQTELEDIQQGATGDFVTLKGKTQATPMAAVDSGVVDLGITKTGFALAFKAAVIFQQINGTYQILKVGPKVKVIAPNNRTDVLAYIGEALSDKLFFIEEKEHSPGEYVIKRGSREPNQYKDRIRNFIERMLQQDVLAYIKNGLVLFDGALTLRTYNTPQNFMEKFVRIAKKNNTDIIGISKKSRITVRNQHISTLLEGTIEPGYRRIVKVDVSGGKEREAEGRNLGSIFVCRFSPGGYTFRVDVARMSLLASEEEVLQVLYANTNMNLGYPNLLRLAHIHSAFTKQEIVSLQVYVAHKYNIKMRRPEDLSVLFAPFRKGIGG